MKKFFLRYSVIIVLLLIIILAYYSGISFGDLLDNLKQLTLWQTIIIVVWVLVIASLSITGKKLILCFLGYRVGFKNIALIHFTSISAHYSTPAKIGYPVTIYLLKKLENIPFAVSTATVVIELFVSVFITGMVGLIGSFMYFSDRLQSLTIGLPLILLAILLITFVVYLLFRKNKKIKALIVDLKESLKLLSARKIIIYFMVQIAVQVAIAIHIIMITRFLKIDITFWHALVSHSSAFIIGAVSMVPMGLGTRDLSMVFYLSNFGVPSEIAIVVTAIQRVVTTGTGYLLGLTAGGIIGIKSIKPVKDKP